MKHSPGPWTQDPEGKVVVTLEDATGTPICDVYGASNDPLGEANCNLIAAAPEMLEALEAFWAAYEPEYVSAMADDSERSLLDEAADAARVAIAKALGQLSGPFPAVSFRRSK